ncbi:MAG: SDR family NAD(P)-dependent oxidoreductase [Candidatus Rokuibacteriota bacterium]|nr:MAG: SDR family NAD(P)-dependent oxidoreductase [Candidatus Rokubacteria bacterium]
MPRGLHAAPEDRGPVEDPAPGGHVRSTVASAGAAHDPGRQYVERRAAAARRGRGHRGGSPLHAHARRGEAELEGGDLGDARRLPRPAGDARGVHGADQGRAGAADLSAALAGKVALITGAGRGIGRAIATAFAAEGAAVALAARSRAELAEVAAEVRARDGRALAVPTDVTQDGAVEALVEQTLADLGRLDILVTSAGTAAFGPVADSKPADWDGMLMLNLRAVMVCCRAVLPAMIRQRSGTILNVSSIATKRALPGSAVYTATKAAIESFSRVLAEELRAHGVRVGVLVPGAVDTPIWDALGSTPPRDKMLKAEDVARAAVLMATLPPHASLEELTLLPAGGIL